MITSKLAYIQLIKNKKRTMITLLGIILSVGMITAIFMFFESANNFLVQSAEVKQVDTSGLLVDKGTISQLFSSCGIIEIIIIISAVLVISNAFQISANERIRQFGILKSVGATKEQIWRIIFNEALFLSAIAIPVGVLTGFFIQKITVEILNNLIRDILAIVSGKKDGELVAVFSWNTTIYSAVLAFLTIIFSVYIPAKKASKISALDAIKLTKEIVIEPRKVKTSKFIQKVWGIEGLLAVKSMKRNSRKYRVTVISLIISMIMFISGFCFSENLNKVTKMRFPDNGSAINVQVSLAGANLKLLETIANQLYHIEGAETWMSYTTVYQSDDLCNMLNPALTDISGINMIQLNSILHKQYSQLCDELAIDSGNTTANRGILINVMNQAENNKTKPICYIQNMVMNFGNNNEHSILLVGEIDNIPIGITPLFGDSSINIIVPEDVFFQYVKEDEKVMVIISAIAENTDDFIGNAQIILNQIENENVVYKLSDIKLDWHQERSTNYLINFFVMGFACMLALIAVTSVIGTITTSIALRWKEFATLKSIGMDQKELHRMLYCESVIYGGKALAFGIPAGVFVSWFIYNVFSETFTYGYIFPWKGILICILAVMLLIFSTTGYSIRKMEKINSMERIMMENV